MENMQLYVWRPVAAKEAPSSSTIEIPTIECPIIASPPHLLHLPRDPSPPIRCLVCDRKAHNDNYGVVSCRACAKFFRRTVASRKSFVCRQGDGKCEIRRDVACICRKCRIEKCLAVGMRPTERNNISNKPEIIDNDNMIENALTAIGYSYYATLADKEKSSLTKVIDTPNDFLNRLGESYRALFTRRQQYEKDMWSKSRYGVVFVASSCGERFRISTSDFSSDIFPHAIAELSNLYASVFPEYGALPEEEKNILMATATESAYVMECSYLTDKYFPKSRRYSFVSTTALFDNESRGLYFTHENADNEALTRFMRFYNDQLNKIMFPVMQTSTLTEVEYYASMAFLFSSFDFAPWMPPRVVEIGLRIKKKVFEELNLYYRNELKCAEMAASRLGHLMMWVHAAQQAGVLLQEELQTYKLMGAYSADDIKMKFFMS